MSRKEGDQWRSVEISGGEQKLINTLMCLLRLDDWLKHLPQTLHLWGRCFSWT